MKRIFVLMTLFIVPSMLAACSAGASTRTSTTSGNNFGSAASGDVRNMTPEAKLALGTIKLEGTTQAVDPVLAVKLLPLWQLLQQLSASATAAPQEVSAVVVQIGTTMTPDQVKAINSMQFTQADLLSAFQQARSGGSGSTGAAGGNRGGGGGGFPGGGGGFPGGGGGFPGGGGGFGGGGVRTSGTGTPTASGAGGSTQSTINRTSTFLVSEVIRLLESKISTKAGVLP